MKRQQLRGGSHKQQAQLRAISASFKQAFGEGRIEAALGFALQATRVAPQLSLPHCDAAACLVRLRRWQEAIDHATVALKLGSNSLSPLDALAQAHGQLGHWEEVRKWGLKALGARLEQFAGPAPIAHRPEPLPPPPSPQTREHNVIAFSLFGGAAKYCETAVLNVEERERLYPHWTCRFYIDESVPDHVVRRLDAPGSRVVRVGAEAKAWPGPMWRFLACDEPGLHRAIFRDADSVIGQREAAAVEEWVASGARFHHMRDGPSHTELLLAGLWGCTAGALPPIRQLVARFMEKPVHSRHFADQYFLREQVWPHARESLLQHDSMFGFMDARPFPGGPREPDFHVGCAEGATPVGMQSELADGTAVTWSIYRAQPRPTRVCSYPGVCRGGRVTIELPRRWALALRDGTMLARIEQAAG